MTITVISKSSEERTDEIKELFKKIKPYLSEGKSYRQAVLLALDINSVSTNRRWFRDLVEYGESQGFSKHEYRGKNIGILNISFLKEKKSPTGYIWAYYSYDDYGNLKRISSYDLNILKMKIESLGLEWIVINESLAKNSFNLNEELLLMKKPRKKYRNNQRTSSGVKYVSKLTTKYSDKICWSYRHENINVQSDSLKDLKEKVENKNGYWFIIDEELYNKNLKLED